MAKKSKFVLLIAAVVLLFFLNITFVGGKIREKFFFLGVPISRSSSFFSALKNIASSPFKINNIVSERDELAKRIITLETDIVTLRAENEDLKKAAAIYEFGKRRGFETILVNVLGRALDSASNSFIIDKGSAHGLAENQIVILGDGVLVGKIIRVEKSRAFFLFLTDERVRFTAAISGKTRALGEARGRLGSSIALELIPREVEVKPNDLVVTAGLESGVPSGLLIGNILEVQPDEATPLQRALIRPAAELTDLRIVSIIR